MIALLKGQVVGAKDDYIILDVRGVGYKVYTPASTQVIAGQQLTLHTYLQVRDDALVLYGFSKQEQLEMFELLISVSGMGPKGALGILSHLDTARLYQAVAAEDVATLTGIPGVGKKTAQRLVLELKDKFKAPSAETLNIPAARDGRADQALEALLALGYTPAEAKAALAKGLKDYPGETDVETMIKLALKQLR